MCGPYACGRCAERVEQIARTSDEGGVLRGKRFAFMVSVCVFAARSSFRNLRAVNVCASFGPIRPIGMAGAFQNAITSPN
jgi:hypothetical protein